MDESTWFIKSVHCMVENRRKQKRKGLPTSSRADHQPPINLLLGLTPISEAPSISSSTTLQPFTHGPFVRMFKTQTIAAHDQEVCLAKRSYLQVSAGDHWSFQACPLVRQQRKTNLNWEPHSPADF